MIRHPSRDGLYHIEERVPHSSVIVLKVVSDVANVYDHVEATLCGIIKQPRQ